MPKKVCVSFNFTVEAYKRFEEMMKKEGKKRGEVVTRADLLRYALRFYENVQDNYDD